MDLNCSVSAKFQPPRLGFSCILRVEDNKREKKEVTTLATAQVESIFSWDWFKVG